MDILNLMLGKVIKVIAYAWKTSSLHIVSWTLFLTALRHSRASVGRIPTLNIEYSECGSLADV